MRGKAERTGLSGRAGPSFLGGGGGPWVGCRAISRGGSSLPLWGQQIRAAVTAPPRPVRGGLAGDTQQPQAPSDHRCLSHGCSQPERPKPQESCHCLLFTLPGSRLLPAWADAAAPPSGAEPAAGPGGGRLSPPEGPSASDQVARQHVILGLSSGLMP